MKDDMDINAGTIITGDKIVEQVGQRKFSEMLEVASGKLTKSEILGHNDFGIWRIGPQCKSAHYSKSIVPWCALVKRKPGWNTIDQALESVLFNSPIFAKNQNKLRGRYAWKHQLG